MKGPSVNMWTVVHQYYIGNVRTKLVFVTATVSQFHQKSNLPVNRKHAEQLFL